MSAPPLWLAAAALVLFTGPALGAQTINLAGGNDATDGLRITIGENTQLQIRREGIGQLYSPTALPPTRSIFNSVYLAEGSTVNCADSSVNTLFNGEQLFQNVSQTLVQGTGIPSDPYQVNTSVRTNAGSTLDMLIYYTYPDQFFVVSTTVTAAPGNTQEFKLYHLMDTYLAGSDSGPAYVDDPLNPTVVGVARNGIYEAFVQLTDPWVNYYSASYGDMFRQISNGADLQNNIDTGNVDNGIGVQWDLGVLTGSVTISYVLAFTDIDFSSIDADHDTVIDLIEGYVNDTDGDEILDYLDPDDDGDGTPTRNEDANGDGRPGNDDADSDGIGDYLEVDSDDDGLGDREERNTTGTDPYDADSDDDGLEDGPELDTYNTNPLDPNSDDDCTTDGAEVAAGSDPASSGSDSGDADLDGVCDDVDPCFGNQDLGDMDEDGFCDDADICTGNDATGDTDEDGICADFELCFIDFDRDGYPNFQASFVPDDEMCDEPGEVEPETPLAGDCNDNDALINPGATETPADGRDADCDGLELCFVDLDHDTWGSDDTRAVDMGMLMEGLRGSCDAPQEDLSSRPGDCDDTDPFAYPNAFEVVADGVDQSCDRTELCWLDNDDDNWLPFGQMPNGLPQGLPPGTILSGDLDCVDPREGDGNTPVGDCDDDNPAIHPTAPEIPNNGIDEDCDQDDLGTTCATDDDDDGWRTEAPRLSADEDCDDPGEVPTDAPGIDCNDNDPDIHPGAFEVVGDGVSQDCDALELCWMDADDDGWRPVGAMPLGAGPPPPPGAVLSLDLDCDDPGEAPDTDPVGDCNDQDPTINPAATDLPVDQIDQNCDGRDGGRLCFADADGDDWRTEESVVSADDDCDDAGEAPPEASAVDCNDEDATIHPTASEVPNDNIDQDCDGDDLGRACFVDADDDGWRLATTLLSADEDCDDAGEASDVDPLLDCDDTDPTIHPTAAEVPNDNIDQDCDDDDLGRVCFVDADDDGWRLNTTLLSADEDCDDAGEASDVDPLLDCDDTNASIHPTASELPNDGVDQDCDGDDLGRDCYVDADDDGWRLETTLRSADEDCDDAGEASDVDPALDCDDTNASIHPTASELPNDGVDQDCDGDDLGRDCYVDADDDGWRLETTLRSADEDCDDAGEASDVDPVLDCDDTNASIHPTASELPNDGVDQDCDGDDLGRDCYVDADDDGWRLETTLRSADEDCDDPGEARAADPTLDCDDTDATIYPGATEVPNDGIDQDCQDGDLGRDCYVDADDDGWRIDTIVLSADEDCDDPGEAGGQVPGPDCDDTNAAIHPGAQDIPGDGVDQDCQGGDAALLCFTDADQDGWRVDTMVQSADADCDDPGEAGGQVPGPDCDDTNAAVYPGAQDVPGDGVDQDCQGGDAALLCFTDADQDGWRVDTLVGSADADCDDPGEADAQDPGPDCDDNDPTSYPGATELPGDASDNDCDGTIDCFVDADGDGWRVDAVVGSLDLDCDDDGEATLQNPALDCDDNDETVYPGANEVPGTGIDADCDGEELCFVDADGDGWRLTDTVVSADPDCDDPGEAYEVTPSEDCDDTNAAIFPGANDVPGDQVDQDCNGDDATMDCAVDADGDGWRVADTVPSADFDCEDPGEAPMDAPSEDCDDNDPNVFPGAPEFADDGEDSDCDTEELCFVDADGDTWRTDAVVTSADLDCDDPGEAHEDAPALDCDDTNATINPDAEEIVADGIDQDCDGQEDCLVDADQDGLRLDDGATRVSEDSDCDDAGEATEETPPLDCDDTSADADADGLSDADEVLSFLTDACDADSDDDELTDGAEINEHQTDPLLPDSDEGGVDDGDEVGRGSDPLDNADDDLPRRWYQGRFACDSGAPVGSMAAVLLALSALRRRRVTVTPVRGDEGGAR